jgi:alpha-tubulin suppressor-like RCC1 family protein
MSALLDFRRLCASILLALTLAACGGSSPSAPTGLADPLSNTPGNSPPPSSPEAPSEAPAAPSTGFSADGGVAQKGPLIKGSPVTVQELDANLAPTGKQYTFQTISDLGNFETPVRFGSKYLSVSASGYYFNESTGKLSDGLVVLRGIVNLETDKILNVNLLTTLAFQRIEKLVRQDRLAFDSAKKQAEREVLTSLGIPSNGIQDSFGMLDIAAGTDGARVLAAASSLFAYGNTAGNLSQLIADFQSDLSDDGKVSDIATLLTLSASARSMNSTQIAENLNKRYAGTNAFFMPADISNWLDQDGDGVLGRMEFQVTSASSSSRQALPIELTDRYASTSISATLGARLILNETPKSGSFQIKAGDRVAVEPDVNGGLPDGALTIYVMSGATRIARVAFVKGLSKISILPDPANMTTGTTTQFSAIATFSDGTTSDLSNKVVWTSNSSSVATIDKSTGLATAKASGIALVSATLGGTAATATVRVSQSTLTSISVAPSSLSLNAGSIQQLRATGRYSDGSTADITATASWFTDNPAVARVTSGTVSAIGSGSASIRASISTGSANLASDPVPITVQVKPVNPPVPLASSSQPTVVGTPVTFSSYGSYDPNTPPRPISNYSWLILSQPPGSLAKLTTSNGTTSTLIPDVPGTYKIMLEIFNGLQFASTTISVNIVAATAPVAYAGRNQSVLVGTRATVVASTDTGTYGTPPPFFYGWTLTDTPLGSNAYLAEFQPWNTAVIKVATDLPGAYTAKVTACLGSPGYSSGCGSFSTVQIRAGNPKDYRSVAAGQAFTVATRYDGSLWSWGLTNERGQLGDGTSSPRYTPIQIGTGFEEVAAGGSHAIAIKSDGTAWAWGSNSAGQLGDGSRTDKSTPKQIGSGFVMVVASWDHSLGLKSDGTVWAWGGNVYGQLGDGTTVGSLVPKQVASGFRHISAAPYRSIGIKTDGTIWAWGQSLGDATGRGGLSPILVASGFSAVQAGISHNVALKPDGTLWAWGTNSSYELGDNSTIPSASPKLIGTEFREIAVSQASGNMNIALKTNGTLWTWGHNGSGQLGTGTYLNAPVPTLIGSNYIAIGGAAGIGGYAIKSDGVMWGWGYIPFGTVNNLLYTAYVPQPSP